ncbi:glycosyltransferase, partial [Candidatus Roizmanbacteria bacterium]|nr:glycosyltransferase [Candidatus Roizmanbacteria bacterium]
MKIAIVNSNYVRISRNTKKGTEIFAYSLIKNLAKKKNLTITAFASGNSKLPVKIESVNYYSSIEDKNIGAENHEKFANALVSKAVKMQNRFDLYHINMGNGEIIFPYAHFIHKPILVTLHGVLNDKYIKKYFSLYNDLKNVFFVSISNSQRKLLPDIHYVKTIHHGVDTKKGFQFNPSGDNYLLWTGRAIPDKGLDIVLQIIKLTKKRAKIFPIIKEEYINWLQEIIIKRRNIINQAVSIYTDFDIHRSNLNYHYQTSKLFLFPLQWEEPFGFTLIESMACGTPIVAFARGSVPEIVKDGETGFIVNSSKDDIRGDWIIKKTGIE